MARLTLLTSGGCATDHLHRVADVADPHRRCSFRPAGGGDQRPPERVVRGRGGRGHPGSSYLRGLRLQDRHDGHREDLAPLAPFDEHPSRGAGRRAVSLGFYVRRIRVVPHHCLFGRLYAEGGGEGLSRYYSLILLFIGGMLGLVMAGNLIQFYFFWEVVGVCSALLIAFWSENRRVRRG